MEKKKRGKHKYIGSYVRNLRGEYEYTGAYFKIDMPADSLKRIKIQSIILAGAIAVLFILAGLTNAPSSRVMYVMLPYAAAMLPIDIYARRRISYRTISKAHDAQTVRPFHSTVENRYHRHPHTDGHLGGGRYCLYSVFLRCRGYYTRTFLFDSLCGYNRRVSVALFMFQRKIICVECGKMTDYRPYFHLYCDFRLLFPVSHHLYTQYWLTFRQFCVKISVIIYITFANRTLCCDSGCSVAPFI